MKEIEGPSHLGKGWSRFRNMNAPFDIVIVLVSWVPAIGFWVVWRLVRAVGATGGVLEMFRNGKVITCGLALFVSAIWLTWLVLWIKGTYDPDLVGVKDTRTYKQMQGRGK